MFIIVMFYLEVGAIHKKNQKSRRATNQFTSRTSGRVPVGLCAGPEEHRDGWKKNGAACPNGNHLFLGNPKQHRSVAKKTLIGVSFFQDEKKELGDDDNRLCVCPAGFNCTHCNISLRVYSDTKEQDVIRGPYRCAMCHNAVKYAREKGLSLLF